jgi:uncharacterized membrane protein YuzA (DUF378 family)
MSSVWQTRRDRRRGQARLAMILVGLAAVAALVFLLVVVLDLRLAPSF